MTYPYTAGDALFQVLRLLVLAGITKATSLGILLWLPTSSSLITYLMMIVLSALQYAFFNMLVNHFMWTTYRCEALNAHDYSFLMEESANSHTIVGVGVFEKFEFESTKKYLLAKAADVHKCKSKLVKRFGVFWYQLMTEEEWKEAADYLVVEGPPIKSQQELRERACEAQANYEFYDKPQFQFILIPDYIDNQSVIILKIHHSFTDGLGIATFF